MQKRFKAKKIRKRNADMTGHGNKLRINVDFLQNTFPYFTCS